MIAPTHTEPGELAGEIHATTGYDGGRFDFNAFQDTPPRFLIRPTTELPAGPTGVPAAE